MIEMKTVQNRRYMQGFALEHSSVAVKVGEGLLDDFVLPAVEFDLMYDSSMPVLHDLYIVEDEQGYDYRLLVTYLDGQTFAYYDQDGKVFHRLMTVKTTPNGFYKGDLVFIEELEIEEVDDGYKTEPDNQTPGSGS